MSLFLKNFLNLQQRPSQRQEGHKISLISFYCWSSFSFGGVLLFYCCYQKRENKTTRVQTSEEETNVTTDCVVRRKQAKLVVLRKHNNKRKRKVDTILQGTKGLSTISFFEIFLCSILSRTRKESVTNMQRSLSLLLLQRRRLLFHGDGGGARGVMATATTDGVVPFCYMAAISYLGCPNFEYYSCRRRHYQRRKNFFCVEEQKRSY